MPNYEKYINDNPNGEKIHDLIKLGQDMVAAEKRVLEKEGDLKEAAEYARNLKEQVIPEAMMQAGVEELKLTGGTVIGLEDILGVTVKKQNKQRVLNWIEDEGHGTIIKRTLSVAFKKDQQEDADALLKILVEDHRMPTKEQREYASGTLKKIVKERREEGKPVPTDIIDVYSVKRAKFVKGKPKVNFEDE